MKVEYDLMAYQLGTLMGQPSRMVIKNDLQMEGFPHPCSFTGGLNKPTLGFNEQTWAFKQTWALNHQNGGFNLTYDGI